MATLYGVNYTKYNTGPTSANIVARGVNGGTVKCLLDTYEAAGTTAGDVVYVGKPLKAGDIVLYWKVAFDDLGTGVTLDLGDTNNDNLYADGIDVATAAGNSDTILVDGMNYVIGTNTDDNILTATLQDAAATGTLKVCIFYVES